MPGIDWTSSSADRRPPVRFEIVPPVATSRTRGTSCADAAVPHSSAANTAAMTRGLLRRRTCPEHRQDTLFGRRVHLGMKRIQVPVEEGPDAIPGIALLARILRLQRL